MELGQGKPPSESEGSSDSGRLLYRNLIISALKDLGSGGVAALIEFKKWKNKQLLDEYCRFADWDREWIESIFNSFEDLHREPDWVRKNIAKDSIRILKKMAKE